MARSDESKGEWFGRYEILSELGRGAMGVVYKARDPKINRTVALKTFLLTGQTEEDIAEFRERFVREAEAAGRISHPGIVTIYDVGEEWDTRAPYIVMEFVAGQTLDAMLSKGDRKLPLETALQLTHELAEALHCAHEQSVVHRDLKPANILITEDGHAKIADFGVAKLNLAGLTMAGRTMGTPAYMSPEQVSGEDVDGRSDLFSLGVVFYTMLTGYRPFQGNSAMTVSFKVVNRQPIPASVLDTQLPRGVDYVIERAMEKDAGLRYQSGAEMALDLEDLSLGRQPRSQAAQQLSTAAGPDGTVKMTALKKTIDAGKSAPLPAKRPIENQMSKVLATVVLLVGLTILGARLVPMLTAKKSAAAPATANTHVAPQLPSGGETASPKPGTAIAAPLPDPGMDLKPAAQPVAKVASAKRIPKKKELVAVAIVPVSVTAPVTPAPLPEPATLNIEVEHKFQEAQLSLWVDSQLLYTHLLEGNDKKRLVVFHKTEGHEFHAIQIPAGKHELRVRVTASVNSVDQSAQLSGEFASGRESMLHVRFDKHGELNLSIQ